MSISTKDLRETASDCEDWTDMRRALLAAADALETRDAALNAYRTAAAWLAKEYDDCGSVDSRTVARFLDAVAAVEDLLAKPPAPARVRPT